MKQFIFMGISVLLLSCSVFKRSNKVNDQINYSFDYYEIVSMQLQRLLIENINQERLLSNHYSNDQIYTLEMSISSSSKSLIVYSMSQSFTEGIASLSPFGYSVIEGHVFYLFGDNSEALFELDENLKKSEVVEKDKREGIISTSLGGEDALWIYEWDESNGFSLDRYELLNK